jgi:hypothetical protein
VCTEAGTVLRTVDRLMGGIYIVNRLDGLRYHNIQIRSKFRKDLFRHSKVDGGRIYTDTRSVIS